jgi:hypothetical protein
MLKIKKGYCLTVVIDTIENKCKNCFFSSHIFNNYTFPSYCLKGMFMPCPNTAHLKHGKNRIYKLMKIKEAQNA